MLYEWAIRLSKNKGTNVNNDINVNNDNNDNNVINDNNDSNANNVITKSLWIKYLTLSACSLPRT